MTTKKISEANDLNHQKTYKKSKIKLLNSFYSSNILSVIAAFNVKIGPKCRNEDWVLGQERV
jgi:hypothetical protein